MISTLLNAPFYTGSSRSANVPYPFQCAIGGHGYFIDLAKYERGTLDLLRQAYDQQGEPGDQTLSIEGFWKRTQNDWSLGAGQDYLDDGGDRSRFFSSTGVDPWERRQISLLNDTARIRTSSETNLALAVAFNAGVAYLFFGSGQTVTYTTDPEAEAPSFTTVTGTPSAAVTGMTTDGQTVWVAFGSSGVYKIVASSPGSATQVSTAATTQVAFANNHLICTHGAEIFELTAAGTKTTIMTHYNTNFTFAAIASAPTGVFAGGNSAGTGHFFFLGYNTDTQRMAVPLPAGRLPDGEQIHAIAEYGGVLALGTSRGVRLAQIVEGRGVGLAPLIETGEAVRCLEPQNDDLWFGWSDYSATKTGLGRAKLSRFSSTLVPAYASDLMAATIGDVRAVVTVGAKRYFAVSASGLWAEQDIKVASGTIDVGWMNFSTPETKVTASLDIRHAPLNGSVSAAIVNEAGSATTAGTSSNAGSYGPVDPWATSSLRGEYFKIQLTLTRDADDTALGPVVYRWTLRSIVAPRQVEQFSVPILLFERVDDGIAEGQTRAFDPLAEWDYLKSLELSRTPVTYQEGNRAYLVTVRSVAIPEGAIRGWDHKRGFFNATIYVRLITLDPGSN